MAEHLLRHELSERGLYWDIASAGTRAHDGQPMDASALGELARRSIEVGEWTSRRLRPESITWADLILTAEARHRTDVVTRQPDALATTFQLLQFARFAAAAEPVTTHDALVVGDELVRRALVARTHVQPAPPAEDDLTDPIGRRARAFRTCADSISSALEQILSPLDGVYGR